MNRQNPDYKSAVQRLIAGDLTRRQAADQLGVKYVTLCAWLKRDKVADKIRGDYTAVDLAQPFKPGNGRGIGAPIDPDKAEALNKAVARVLAGEISARSVARETGLSGGSIANKVRKIRIAKGQPVRARTAPGPRVPKA